ncbi:WecB/TagA/CpsF family glycosyltransferase [Pseudoalteromonas piscicida]|uniref:N-acetylglucosaminyldiphosphoundecaprenol N-acetyl-beta-D-mannosaminyltransferase n=1 Tax=Pseudoalteromonas piscicida TaxID=43662 RepID=A0ABN5CHA6_PSEO7|nr:MULTISPECIES: WecB/TagA/CpsF family glycosyltransferase [Pseudoalteromonas]ATD08949.1 N-acetylglucosaminyldiphosphoundecaprenol N-acetyl-beta-D-mannosaminyltransferase [Pseudoalteromonas piscicida]ODB36802.1 lipopolysaccharide N-acetylmannosaminouronosyltransferase [Pseudoalteromonas sp. BMB]WPU30931.1 WecB/TagA/CpsF family glycosyltransferase [Pseudoalteromonas piscicida]
MNSANEITIRGIPVTAFGSIQDLIESAILRESNVVPGVAVAINPEKVMVAERDQETRQVLLDATLRYADGIGVSYVMSKKSNAKVARIPGCELWTQLMISAASLNTPVYLLGASATVIELTKTKLQGLGVNVVGARDGYFEDREEVIAEIKDSGAQIITVALGSPKQEKFIFECRKQVPNAFYMGVGGTYDVYTGNVKRAPKLWIKLHLEWLYRLLSQPSRLFRQGKLLKFVYYYLVGKI